MLKIRVVFVLLVICTSFCITFASHAAMICYQAKCNISIDFLNGGTINTQTQATLIFGTDASVSLGKGGDIQLGDGGVLDNVTHQALNGAEIPPVGSAITLGNDANINFGTNGWIDLGSGGNIQYNEDNTLVLSNSSSIVIYGASGAVVSLEGINFAGAVMLHASDLIQYTGVNTGSGLLVESSDTTSTLDINASTIIVNGDGIAAGQLELASEQLELNNAQAGIIGNKPATTCVQNSTPSSDAGSITIGSSAAVDLKLLPSGCTITVPALPEQPSRIVLETPIATSPVLAGENVINQPGTVTSEPVELPIVIDGIVEIDAIGTVTSQLAEDSGEAASGEQIQSDSQPSTPPPSKPAAGEAAPTDSGGAFSLWWLAVLVIRRMMCGRLCGLSYKSGSLF